MDGVWFVKMGGGTSGRCMVCVGDGVETKSMVAHDKINQQWEGQGSMGHDELRDMRHLVPMKKEDYYKHKPHLLKITYCYRAILNLQNQPQKTKWIKRKNIRNCLKVLS